VSEPDQAKFLACTDQVDACMAALDQAGSFSDS
jgi:hypothetical protein